MTADMERLEESGEAMAVDAEAEELKTIMGKMYSVEGVAAALGCNARTVLNLLRSGKLHGVKVGKVWTISKQNFENFIQG
ncbi:hypothetical protein FACS1894187_20140 [Synergistales bacterium]|nr:hypothetical protein FACS1894187_20140 [Synergistales bacterium]